jgi:hypothetical protein
MADFTVTLGSFEFRDFEVPSRAPFGGAQALTIHKLIGGVRVIDAMGRDDTQIKWDGTFLSPDADDRARVLDGLRVAGAALLLVWGAHRYSVVIQSFLPVYQHSSEVPYTIACEVLADLSQPIAVPPTTLDDGFNDDLVDSVGVADGLNLPGVTAALGTVQQVLSLAGSITGGSSAQLGQITTALGQGQAVLAPLIATQDGFLGSLATLGGVVAGKANAAALQAAAKAAQQLPQLLQANNDMTNMAQAIGGISL